MFKLWCWNALGYYITYSTSIVIVIIIIDFNGLCEPGKRGTKAQRDSGRRHALPCLSQILLASPPSCAKWENKSLWPFANGIGRCRLQLSYVYSWRAHSIFLIDCASFFLFFSFSFLLNQKEGRRQRRKNSFQVFDHHKSVASGKQLAIKKNNKNNSRY